jgi:hypothetical protein
MPVGPYSPDPVTRVINVHWGGLAVEFGDKDQDASKPSTPLPGPP